MRSALWISAFSLMVAPTANAAEEEVYAELPACPGPNNQIQVSAKHYMPANSENVEVDGGLPLYGPGTMHNAPAPYNVSRPNHAVWHFMASNTGTYLFDVTYAALDSRPVQISVNGKIITTHGLAATTDGWFAKDRKTFRQTTVELQRGVNELDFQRGDVFPHIYMMTFTRVCPPGRQQAE